jgi:polyhydroxybutyrate depolymerase
MTRIAMKRDAWIAGTVLCATLACLAGCGSAKEPAGPEELPPPRGFWGLSRDFVDTLSFGGRDRLFHVHLPSAYDHQTRLPLLLVFHGSGTSFGQMRDWTGFDSVADDERFVVVYPGAYGSWADSDVEFVPELVDHLTDQWAVDPSRVALTGFSAGGFLSHRLACEPGFPVKAVATVGATVRTTTRDVCDPPGLSRGTPVSALLMLGDQDSSVPLEGRDDALSFAESATMWRAIDGCSGSPAVVFWPGEGADPHVKTEISTECTADTEVRAAVMAGLGHTWPRPDTNPSSIDATEIVAEFVVRQW